MKPLSLVLAVLFSVTFVPGQRGYPPAITDAEELVYKTVGETELKLWKFSPEAETSKEGVPAILFFFGGGWRSGSPTQFAPHARYLAERGMAAMVVDYRVSSRHGTKAKDCVEDARDAVRFVRREAKKLGVDPDQILVGGGSAGGHIAACLGVIDEDPESKPVAMALFNPACVLAPYEGEMEVLAERSEELSERMGVPVETLSPIHHVTASAVPAVMFHGTKDPTVPHATAVLFTKAMQEVGVKCVLHSYEGEGHGFFNEGRKPAEGNEPAFPQTLVQLDEFLVELGFLEAHAE